jgi:hypothetical protein
MTVPARFVHVGFSFSSGTPSTDELEKTFNLALDWVRYDTHCWILYTSTELDTWRDRIRNVSIIKPTDSFFLCEFERGKYSGYQHKVVWDFMAKQRE